MADLSPLTETQRQPLNAKKGSTYKFDYVFLKRFFKLFWQFLSKGNSTGLLFTFLLFLCFLEQFVVFRVGLITSAYYKILGDKDLPMFWRQTFYSSLLVLAIAIVKSSKDFTSSTLYVTWRETLSTHLHSLYFRGDSYYKVNVLEQDASIKIDNPDQRMTQDIDQMCSYLSKTVPQLLVSPFVIGYYSYNSFQTTGIVGPLGCFIFFLLTTIISKTLMSPVVNLVYRKEQAEGYFRFQHLHVRTAGESIAFMDGGGLEEKIANKQLRTLVKSMEMLIVRQLFLGFAINCTDYFGSIVSFLVLAAPLFTGFYNNLSPTSLSELISKNAFVSMYLISQFTQLVDLSEELSKVAGTTHRIGQLAEALENMHCEEKSHCNDHPRGDEGDDWDEEGKEKVPLSSSSSQTFYKLNHVTLMEPNTSGFAPKTLLTNLSLHVRQGTNILIKGPSGQGKTSILRLLRGLWKENAGLVERYLLPCHSSHGKTVLFLPQRPVLAWGSLRQQLIYPDEVLLPSSGSRKWRDEEMGEGRQSGFAEDLTTREIKRHLRFLGIENLLDRVSGDLDREVTWNWEDSLSPGEMQRIAIARLFYHKPLLAVLDEATSAVSYEMEEAIYLELARLNITVISCGHRESLFKFHDIVLASTGDGQWSAKSTVRA